MKESVVRYKSGEIMKEGDSVIVDGKHDAIIEKILIPGTQMARLMNCDNDITILLRRDDIGLVEEYPDDVNMAFRSRKEK
jgi:hypothetical protein